ncbi:MAG: alpha/beta hydrolase [Bacteroidota bacterium]
MKKVFLLFIILVSCSFSKSFAQVEYVKMNSSILQEERKLKVLLPRNYDRNKDKEYPVIMVFDADFMFEPIAGMVDYLSYWEEIPEAIVVGVMQQGHRENDMKYDDDNYLPVASGENFFDFIELELMSQIEENYRTSTMRIAIGHNKTANFINYFLFREDPLFQGYIAFSPVFSPKMPNRVRRALLKSKRRTWYFIANGTMENKSIKQDVKDLAEELDLVDNPKVTFNYEEFNEANHFTSVSQGIPVALESIFSIYQPIKEQEYEDVILTKENPVEYLEDRYYEIAEFYNLDIDVRVSDIMYISRAIEESENWDAYKDLSKIAKKNHPETLLESYFLARHYQEIGKPKKALKHYQDAYGYDEVGELDKDLMLERAEEIKSTFGL